MTVSSKNPTLSLPIKKKKKEEGEEVEGREEERTAKSFGTKNQKKLEANAEPPCNLLLVHTPRHPPSSSQEEAAKSSGQRGWSPSTAQLGGEMMRWGSDIMMLTHKPLL